MRTQAEHSPQASLFRGVRQFRLRATSSAKSFLPTPSSPANSNAPGSLPDSSMRFSTSLTRAFPAIRSNIGLDLCVLIFVLCSLFYGRQNTKNKTQSTKLKRVHDLSRKKQRLPSHVPACVRVDHSRQLPSLAPVRLPRSVDKRRARENETPRLRCRVDRGQLCLPRSCLSIAAWCGWSILRYPRRKARLSPASNLRLRGKRSPQSSPAGTRVPRLDKRRSHRRSDPKSRSARIPAPAGSLVARVARDRQQRRVVLSADQLLQRRRAVRRVVAVRRACRRVRESRVGSNPVLAGSC